MFSQNFDILTHTNSVLECRRNVKCKMFSSWMLSSDRILPTLICFFFCEYKTLLSKRNAFSDLGLTFRTVDGVTHLIVQFGPWLSHCPSHHSRHCPCCPWPWFSRCRYGRPHQFFQCMVLLVNVFANVRLPRCVRNCVFHGHSIAAACYRCSVCLWCVPEDFGMPRDHRSAESLGAQVLSSVLSMLTLHTVQLLLT